MAKEGKRKKGIGYERMRKKGRGEKRIYIYI